MRGLLEDHGRHVGYATPAGFNRASDGTSASPRAGTSRWFAVPSISSDRTDTQVTALVADKSAEPPPIPPYSGPVRVNDCHVLLWVYRGHARIRIGARECQLERGLAVWVPAGISNQVELDADSILFPLGNRYGRVRTSTDELRIFELGEAAADQLLRTYLSEYTLLQPDTPSTIADELFTEQFRRGNPDSTRLASVVGGNRRWAAPRSGRLAFSRRMGQSAQHHTDRVEQGVRRADRDYFPSLACTGAGEHRPKVAVFGRTNRSGCPCPRLRPPTSFIKVFTAAHGMSPGE